MHGFDMELGFRIQNVPDTKKEATVDALIVSGFHADNLMLSERRRLFGPASNRTVYR